MQNRTVVKIGGTRTCGFPFMRILQAVFTVCLDAATIPDRRGRRGRRGLILSRKYSEHPAGEVSLGDRVDTAPARTTGPSPTPVETNGLVARTAASLAGPPLANGWRHVRE